MRNVADQHTSETRPALLFTYVSDAMVDGRRKDSAYVAIIGIYYTVSRGCGSLGSTQTDFELVGPG